ncbi:MAG TPA: DUF924 family protein [Hyphomicrobiales bacterium]|nr:DUF924 family protein [Hyphomicrobiales bacterium]
MINSEDLDAMRNVLDFWFSDRVQEKWFDADNEFDSELKERFGVLSDKAVAGELESWRRTAEGAVALVALLDQMPRNIYRGTPRAFAGDARALEVSREVISRGDDNGLDQDRRYILYMPFMHAEDLAAQNEGVRLFEKLGREKPLDYMKRHRDIVARFGRFPHRNEILGREATAEEVEFLKQRGSSF